MSDSWTKLGPVPRRSQSAAAVGERIYLPGGRTRRSGTPARSPAITAQVDAFPDREGDEVGSWY